MAKEERIYTGRHCTIDGYDGIFKVFVWMPAGGLVFIKGVDEAGMLLCSIDPSGMLAVARKDVHWIKKEDHTLWN